MNICSQDDKTKPLVGNRQVFFLEEEDLQSNREINVHVFSRFIESELLFASLLPGFLLHECLHAYMRRLG